MAPAGLREQLRAGKTAPRSINMACCIERHRRLLAALATFSRKATAARDRAWGAPAAWLGLTISQILERSARRRLIRRKPVGIFEAEQKILYLIAVTVGQDIDLRPAEIREVVASVEEFKAELAALLRGVGHRDSVNSMDGDPHLRMVIGDCENRAGSDQTTTKECARGFLFRPKR